MTDQEKKELVDKKMEEAQSLRKEFPNLPAVYIYSTLILCSFNIEKAREMIKSKS